MPGPAGDVSVRVYIPETVRGVYLHIHGGGFMLGRAHHADVELVELAKACQAALFTVFPGTFKSG